MLVLVPYFMNLSLFASIKFFLWYFLLFSLFLKNESPLQGDAIGVGSFEKMLGVTQFL